MTPANQPAFPTSNYAGITIRDWFAAQCLPEASRLFSCRSPHAIAHEAYRMADAMLDVRAEA